MGSPTKNYPFRTMDPETPKIDASKASTLPDNASEEIRNLNAGLQKILYGHKQVQNTPTNTTASSQEPNSNISSDQTQNLDAGLQRILYAQKQVQNTPTNTTASRGEPDLNISSEQTQNLDAGLQKDLYGQNQVQNTPTNTTASRGEPDSNIASDQTQNLDAGLQKDLYGQKQVQNIPTNEISSIQEPEKNISTPDLDAEVRGILFGYSGLLGPTTPTDTTSSSQESDPNMLRSQASSFSEPDPTTTSSSQESDPNMLRNQASSFSESDPTIDMNQQSLVWKRNYYWEFGGLRKPFTICRVYLADVDLDRVRESLEEKVRNQGHNLHDGSSKASFMNSSVFSNEDKENDERSLGKASNIGKPRKINDFNLTQLRDELKDLDAKPEGRQ